MLLRMKWIVYLAYSRNRRGIRVVEMQKLNPHYVVSAARLKNKQKKM